MEQYPLGSLMQLREFRKEEAQRATMAQRHQVTAAQKAYQKGQEDLEAFIIKVNQRIDSIYDSVIKTFPILGTIIGNVLLSSLN